ncbi:hypothetical protein SLA2020_508610 [Shorea laevis]
MSTEDAKKSVTGATVIKPSSDDRKQSAAAAAAPASGKRFIIKSADMKEDMQKEAVDIAIAAFDKHNVEKDVAEHIKKEFDKKHGPTWHCIVGRNFGSYVTHETNHFVYFYLDQKAVLLFKSVELGFLCLQIVVSQFIIFWVCLLHSPLSAVFISFVK